MAYPIESLLMPFGHPRILLAEELRFPCNSSGDCGIPLLHHSILSVVCVPDQIVYVQNLLLKQLLIRR